MWKSSADKLFEYEWGIYKKYKKKTANESKDSMKWENDNLVRERIEKKEITEWLKEE